MSGRPVFEMQALILVFPDAAGSIFNPAISAFVDAVEERVDEAFVTFALANGRHPSVRDALAAAAFAGCRSVVIALLDERLPVPALGRATAARVVRCRRDPAAVASHFQAARAGEILACAS